MPELMPVAVSADSPSAANTDPYQLSIALDTSTCQSGAFSRPKKRDLMEMMAKTLTGKEIGIKPIRLVYVSHLMLSPWCVGHVCADLCPPKRKERDARDQRQQREGRTKY